MKKELFMKLKWVMLLSLVAGLLGLTGCPGNGGGPTGPANAPVLSNIRVNPLEASPGAFITFFIDFVDVSGDLNGGTAVISLQGQENAYQETVYNPVSNAEGTAGTLTTFVELSPLVPRGTLLITIFVQDLAGNPSNSISITITVV
jgi:hypothetical protein